MYFFQSSPYHKHQRKNNIQFIGYLTVGKRFYDNNGVCNFLQTDLRSARAISRLSNV